MKKNYFYILFLLLIFFLVSTISLAQVTTGTNTITSIFTGENYNTREKCQNAGEVMYGSRLVGVIFDETEKKCTIIGVKHDAPKEILKHVEKINVNNLFAKNVAKPVNLSERISEIYNWGIGIVGILAFVMIVYGGILYMISGAIDQKTKAKTVIVNALIGLALALVSFITVNFVNPKLTKIEPPKLTPVSPVSAPTGCIQKGSDAYNQLVEQCLATGGTNRADCESTVTTCSSATPLTTDGTPYTSKGTGEQCLTYPQLQSLADQGYTCGAVTVGELDCPKDINNPQGSFICTPPSE